MTGARYQYPLDKQMIYESAPQVIPNESHLPEPVRLGPSPERTPPFTAIYPDATPKFFYQPEKTPQRRCHAWKRWPFLLLLSLLIAVIAGIIGGFIGKTIESNSRNASLSPQTSASTCSPKPSSSTSPSPPNSNTNTSTMAEISYPDTGCPDAHNQTFESNASHQVYRQFCNIDWSSNDFVAISANSISDCVEACYSVNHVRKEGDKECVGVTLVPLWTNQTLAVEKTGVAGNCFLKEKIEGYPVNKLAYKRDTVSMCFPSTCP